MVAGAVVVIVWISWIKPLATINAFFVMYEIRIKDGNTPRALISKTKDDKEPQVHIYHN